MHLSPQRSALTYYPHVHGIVPGGGLSLDGKRWVSCKPGFFLLVRVLSRLFRRRFLETLQKAYRGGNLQFFGERADLTDAKAFAKWLAPLGQCEWGCMPNARLSGRKRYWTICCAERTGCRLHRIGGQGRKLPKYLSPAVSNDPLCATLI